MSSNDHATTNSTHTTASQPSKQQYTYTFHRQPLNSSVGRALISELDAELSGMYADIMPADGYRGSPTPTAAPDLPIQEPIVRLDGDGDVQASQSTAQQDPAAATKVLSSLQEAAERDDVVFVVAYATPISSQTGVPNGTIASTPSPSTSTNTATSPSSPPPPNSTPAGCYALLFHSHPPDSPGLPFPPNLRIAELRRCYIRPQFRGPSQSSTSVPLSSLLLSHCHSYAQSTLKLQRLILVTGYRQLAAIRVYERAGWTDRGEIGLWGTFIDEVKSRGMEGKGMLRCMEKILE